MAADRQVWIPGTRASRATSPRYTPHRGFDPAFSHKLELYHEIMTVYYAAGPPVESSSAAAEVDCNPRPEESLA